jgi:acyl carrier protein
VPILTDILPRLQAIFRDELDIADLNIAADSTPDQIDGWDSLATIRIIAAVEREFNREFGAAQMDSVKSVADIISVISKSQPS